MIANINIQTIWKDKYMQEFAHKPCYSSLQSQHWCSDVTYIPTDEGWLFLAVIMDFDCGKIIGWSISNQLNESNIEAMRMALVKHKIHSELLLHSSSVLLYASENFKLLLEQQGIQCGICQEKDCAENVAMKSFMSTIKKQWTYPVHYRTCAEAKKSIIDYLETFYI